MKKMVLRLATLICLLATMVGLVACNEVESTNENVQLSFVNDVLELEIFDEEELQYSYNGEDSLVWSVADSTVLTVNNGVVVALKQGQTVVTVSAGELSDSIAVTVKEVNAALLELSIEEIQMSMYVEDTYNLAPTLTYNGKVVATAQFEFESANNIIASVSEDGVITANSIGETEVFVNASFFNKTVGQIVNVTVTPSGKVTLDKQSVSLYALAELNGETYENTATIVATITEKGISKSNANLTWVSKNNSVAIVENGLITAVSSGTTEVVASYIGEDGVGVDATVIVTVSPATSTLSESVDIVKTETINISEFFEGAEISVSKAYLTDGVLNKDVTITEGNISVAETGFIGNVTLILESDKALIQVPICVWTALISSVSELEELRAATEGYYRLTQNLDLTNVVWAYAEEVVFKGVFDGNGKTLTNFEPSSCGLFNVLGNGAKISNLNFENATIDESNTSVGVLAKSIQENAIVDIEEICGNVILSGVNCGGLIGLIYRNSSVTVKNCNLHVYASDTATGKGAFVGSADGAVNMPTGASSSFISNLKLCGDAKTSDVDNSSCNSINLVETVKPIAMEKLNYFDVILNDKTEVEFDVANVSKTIILGNTLEVVTYSDGKVEIPISQVEGYKVNSVEVIFETENGVKLYYAIPIEVGEIKINNANKELLKTVPKGTLSLQEDIDLAGIKWDTTLTFEGVLDGNGYAIKNLTTCDNNGFFKDVRGAVIKNVAFMNVKLGLSSGTIAFQPTGGMTVENVFIEVIDSSPLGRVGAICERSTKAVALNLKDVVIKMTNRNANASIYGYMIYGTSELTNVHCIGLKDRVESVCNAGHGYIANTSTYKFYSDVIAFDKAEKTLTPFLKRCVEEKFGVVKITQSNVTDLLSLKGSETIYLAEDIDLAGITWNTTVAFTGTFDGGNHAIKNLTTQGSNGFFKTAAGTIKNVAFVDTVLCATASSAVVAGSATTTLNIENVFIDVKSTGTGANYGAIIERTLTAVVNLTDVVISMPGTNSKEAIYGWAVKNTSSCALTNIYVIGLANATTSYAQIVQCGLNKTNNNFYEDVTAFNSAEKTLTDFLTSCVAMHLNVNTEN